MIYLGNGLYSNSGESLSHYGVPGMKKDSKFLKTNVDWDNPESVARYYAERRQRNNTGIRAPIKRPTITRKDPRDARHDQLIYNSEYVGRERYHRPRSTVNRLAFRAKNEAKTAYEDIKRKAGNLYDDYVRGHKRQREADEAKREALRQLDSGFRQRRDMSNYKDAPSGTRNKPHEIKKRSAASSAIVKAKNTYSDVKKKASDTYEDIKKDAKGTYKNLKKEASNAYDDAKKTAKDLYKKAKKTVVGEDAKRSNQWSKNGSTIKVKRKDNRTVVGKAIDKFTGTSDWASGSKRSDIKVRRKGDIQVKRKSPRGDDIVDKAKRTVNHIKKDWDTRNTGWNKATKYATKGKKKKKSNSGIRSALGW